MTKLTEAGLEEHVIALLQDQGYTHISRADLETERESTSDVILHARLLAALGRLNPDLPAAVIEQAGRQVAALSGRNLIESNEAFYLMLLEGVAEEYQQDGETVGARVRVMDFENPRGNDLAVCGQFTVTEHHVTKRPDVVLFVNGLPVAVIELKNPIDEQATVEKAFNQLQNYTQTIPGLFCYNGVLVASDGFEARVGSLTAGWNRFMAWKTVDGDREAARTTPQMNTMIQGLLRPDVLLDVMRYFTVFESVKRAGVGGTVATKDKKIAAYHQYHAVKKAVQSTIRASQGNRPDVQEQPEAYGRHSVTTQPIGDRKAGVVWHTQGSGKSLSMVFYAGALIAHPQMANPTIVVITDRNDLDDQLFQAFTAGRTLLRQEPKQAGSRAELKALLKTSGGGVVFSTLQKFSPDDGSECFETLSERHNIVVIADEAHRSQYGFGVKTFFVKDGVKTAYGFAKYLRDALPDASFIGFTGTPIEKEDASTPAVFGHYIDVYDIEQAVADGATVPIYYESRLVQVHLTEDERAELDRAVEEITERAESTAAERAKTKWTRQEAIIGHGDRVRTVVDDLLQHVDARRDAFEGKAMVVATSRRIAVAMYAAITARRPDWHDDDPRKGAVKVVMTSSPGDPAAWHAHTTTPNDRRALGDRFKDPTDPLSMVIVCDMWLTGFDVPCLDALYVDKMMSGHNLMQAIARVNRVYKDKAGGLVVDYIGIASDLKRALLDYTHNGGKGAPAYEQARAVDTMLEKHGVVADMFGACDYAAYFSANAGDKMDIILDAADYILGLPDGKERLHKEVTLLSKAFALSVPDQRAMDIRADVGLFQAINARLTALAPKERGDGHGDHHGDVATETAIRQIVDRAVVVDGVIDIFDAAGIKKPDISILSDEFLEEIRGMTRRNLALELLVKLLKGELKTRTRKNLAQSKKFSDLLEAAIRQYKNNLLTAAEVIEELIRLARDITAADTRAADLGLSDDEIAFYDALVMNDSAKAVMADATLKTLAQMLTAKVKTNTSIDWTIKESARAKLRTIVRRLLQRYGYPPDEQLIATDRILQQAELMADDWTAG